MLKSILTASFGVMIAVSQIAMGEEKPSSTPAPTSADSESKQGSEENKAPKAEPIKKSAPKKLEDKKSAATNGSHDHKKDKRQGHAHNHGTSRIDIVATGKNLTISGEFPLMDLLGFERVPMSEEEKTSLGNVFQIFRQGSVIQPAVSGCTMTKMEANVEPPFTATPRTRRTRNSSAADTHHGIDFELAWQCPEEVTKLKVGVFDNYPGVNQINIQFINQTKQGSISLKRADKKTEIELK